MNILNLIREKQIKRNRLTEAQRLMAKAYRGIDYTSAHLSPVLLEDHTLTYRGHEYLQHH